MKKKIIATIPHLVSIPFSQFSHVTYNALI